MDKVSHVDWVVLDCYFREPAGSDSDADTMPMAARSKHQDCTQTSCTTHNKYCDRSINLVIVVPTRGIGSYCSISFQGTLRHGGKALVRQMIVPQLVVTESSDASCVAPGRVYKSYRSHSDLRRMSYQQE